MIKSKLSTLLGERRIKISHLADRTGLSRNTLTNLYYDKTTRYDQHVLNAVCRALDCQLGNLLEYVPDDKDNKYLKTLIQGTMLTDFGSVRQSCFECIVKT